MQDPLFVTKNYPEITSIKESKETIKHIEFPQINEFSEAKDELENQKLSLNLNKDKQVFNLDLSTKNLKQPENEPSPINIKQSEDLNSLWASQVIEPSSLIKDGEKNIRDLHLI